MSIEKKVNTKFSAKDAITKRFGIMAKASARFGRTAFGAFKRVNNQATKFRGITSGFLKAQVIGKGFGLLTRGIGSVVDGFIQFDKAALGATVRFKDIGPKATNFNDKLKEIERSARDAGATTEFTAAQAAESLDFLARAGFTSAEAMASLGAMINLATATGEDFNSVADKSSDLLGSFGLNADNTAQKIENLNRLNDVLVKTANSTNTTIETMFETMKTAAPIGRKLGIELEEVAALTGVLGNAGIKGTAAGTAMKNMFLRLSAPTDAIKNTLKDIRVEIDDGSGNMRKFSTIMKDISGATSEFGNLKVAEVLDTLFGKRAIAGAANVGDSIKQLEDLEKVLLNAGGTAKLTAEIMRTSIDAKLKTLASTATEAGFKILSAFRIDGKNGIDALTEAIRNADIQPFIETLKVMASTVATIATGFFEMGAGLGIIAGKIAEISESRLGGISSDVFKRAEQTGLFKPGVAERFASAFGGTPAPNAAEATAKAQTSKFTGQLNIAGAPEGSTVETSQNVPGFDMTLQGAN